MIKDFEGLSRMIIGFSKFPKIDGEFIQIDYKLKPLDINWLREMFNIDPNHHNFLVRSMEDKNYKLNKKQYEMLKPYMIGDPVDFEKYNFFLDTGGGSLKKWDWRTGYPIQIKNAAIKIEHYYTKKITDPVFIPYILNKDKQTIALQLGINYWDEFYKHIRSNYPFTELSIYRIDWDSIKNSKRLSWEQAISSPKDNREFLKNSCINRFKEVIIAYGPREPVILISLNYIYDYGLGSLFDQEWGACFIIGAKRNKYGIVKLVHDCFVEVDCDDCLNSL